MKEKLKIGIRYIVILILTLVFAVYYGIRAATNWEDHRVVLRVWWKKQSVWSIGAKTLMALAVIILLLYLGLATSPVAETPKLVPFAALETPVFQVSPMSRPSSSLAEFPLSKKEKEMFRAVGFNVDTMTEWPMGYRMTKEQKLVRTPGRFLGDGSFALDGISAIQIYFSPESWVIYEKGLFIQNNPNWRLALEHNLLGEKPFERENSFFNGVDNVRMFRLEDDPPSLKNLNIDYARPKRVRHHKYDAAVSYIRQFATAAVVTQMEEGIPASITLAQGMLESKHGTSALSLRSNNHFGVKCHIKEHAKWVKKNGKWVRYGTSVGHCVNFHDDDADDMFLAFPDALSCYEWRAKWLKNSPRYGTLFDGYRPAFEIAQGLEDRGYATVHDFVKGKDGKIRKRRLYADHLQGLIKKYNLTQFDHYVGK